MWPDPTAPDPRRVAYLIAVDLAQGGKDWTALAVVERWRRDDGGPADYRVTHLERWRDARTALVPERVAAVDQQLRHLHADRDLRRYGRSPATTPAVEVVVDRTGVGPFGLDPLRAAGFDPIGIALHGGEAVSHDDAGGWRVPKRDLAAVVRVLLETRRLRVAAALPLAGVLRSELENFKAKITLGGRDTYGAGQDWREGNHDDLVLATAMAVWLGEHRAGSTLRPASPDLRRYFL